MKDTVKLTPNDKQNWIKTHTLTPEQRQIVVTQKLERAVKQFKAQHKIPVLV